MRLNERMIGDLFLKATGGQVKIDERIEGDVVIVAVTGDLTVNSGGDEALRSRMHGAIRQGHRQLLVDLSGVPYIDSSGVGVLVQAYAATKNIGGSLKLLRPTKHLRDLFALTKLNAVLDSYEDEAAALESFVTLG